MSYNEGLLENVLIVCVCFFIVLVPSAMIASAMPLQFPLERALLGLASTIAVIGGVALYMLRF